MGVYEGALKPTKSSGTSSHCKLLLSAANRERYSPVRACYNRAVYLYRPWEKRCSRLKFDGMERA